MKLVQHPAYMCCFSVLLTRACLWYLHCLRVVIRMLKYVVLSNIYAWLASHVMYILILWIKDLGRMLWFCNKLVGAKLLNFFVFYVSENHRANNSENSNWLTDWYCRVCKNEVLARETSLVRANGHLRAVPTRNAEGKWLAWTWAASLYQPPAFRFRCWFSGSTYSGAWSFGSNDHSQ